MRAESLQLTRLGFGSENEAKELHRLEATGEISELRGKLQGGRAGDCTAFVGRAQEYERTGQLVGRVAPHERIACKLVCAA
jgi:hypothetical protein